MYQAEIIVSGLVQGVNYRYNTRETAQKIGLVGWVKNMPDETVKIIAQGEKEKIDKLLVWCREGSEIAKVEDVKVNWSELGEDTEIYQEFEIEY